MTQKDPGKFSAHVVFGEDDCRSLADGRYAKMENRYTTYSFPTEAELSAFLQGLDAAIGWLEATVLEPEEKRRVDRAAQARARRAKKAKGGGGMAPGGLSE